ncbi:hypothetical protein IGI67_001175 [Enterococcus sp. AZ196]
MFYDNIRPEYFLRKWKYYEAAREVLDPIELENATIFFHGMKRLSQSDLNLLSDVYYKNAKPCTVDRKNGYMTSVKPVKNGLLASKYHVSAIQFKELRKQAQENLKAAMQEVLDEIALYFVYRINRNLYLVDIVERGTRKEKYVLGEECDAKKFGSSDSEQEASHLKSLGFERVPVNEERQ